MVRFRLSARAVRLIALTLVVYALLAQLPQPDGGPVEGGVLPARWITGGPKCMEVPDWQVQEYNQDFYILRESGCTHYEKPFLYLIFGKDKALLEDTGAGQPEVRSIVSNVVAKWCKRKQRASIPLVVMHSHGHSDHVAGDKQMQEMPGVEFIPATVPGVQKAFGIGQWPSQVGRIDLGERVLDVVPIPGHQVAAIALYDRKTGVLLTGDNLYPGRLYVFDWAAFVESTQRLVDFTAQRQVTHILGCHIEQTDRPFREYPIGSIYQPGEHPLELARAHLLELNYALAAHRDQPERLAYRDFTLWPMPPEVLQEMRRLREQTENLQRQKQWDQDK